MLERLIFAAIAGRITLYIRQDGSKQREQVLTGAVIFWDQVIDAGLLGGRMRLTALIVLIFNNLNYKMQSSTNI